jgi:hypothetical protein
MPLGFFSREGQSDALTCKSGDLPDMHPRKGCVTDAGVRVGPVPTKGHKVPFIPSSNKIYVPGLAQRDKDKTL